MTSQSPNNSCQYGELRSVLASSDRALPTQLCKMLEQWSTPLSDPLSHYLSISAHRWDPRGEHQIPFAQLVSAWMQGECLVLLECLQNFPSDLIERIDREGVGSLEEAFEWTQYGGLNPGRCWFQFALQDLQIPQQVCQWLSTCSSIRAQIFHDATEQGWSSSNILIDRGGIQLDWLGVSWTKAYVELSIMEGEPWNKEALVSLFEIAFRLGCREIIESSGNKGPEGAFALYSSLRLA